MSRLLVVLGLLSVACTPPAATRVWADDKPVTSDEEPSGGSFGTSTPADSDATSDGCAEHARVPYVLSRAGDLFRFDVPKMKVDKVGRLDCTLDADEGVISMAVDRAGTAWVSTTLGNLLEVDTKTASCKPVPTFAAASFGWRSFGMGFSSNGKASAEETLFIAELTNDPATAPSKGLGKIDTQEFAFEPIGPYSADFAGASSELTGTGDGRLYAFIVQDYVKRSTSSLVQLDRKTGNVIEDVPLQFKVGYGYAFSFWGGDFWFYTGETESGIEKANSKIVRLRYASDKKEEVVIPDVGFNIVGAGVSTCAPTSAPK